MVGISSVVLNLNNLSSTPSQFNPLLNPGPYNRFYLPISNGQNLKDFQLCIAKINMYYAFPNINANNYQAMTIEWPVGAGYQSFSFNLTPNFNYSSISAINDALQAFCIDNGLYLINGSTNVYYITLVANPNSYGVDLTLFVVPDTTSYTLPSNYPVGGLPTTGATPKVSFKSSFNEIVGFPTSTTYDGATTQTSWTSAFCPQLSPVSSILVNSNIAFNPLALNGSTSTMLVFTTKDTNYGATITVEPQELIWFDVNVSNASMLTIELYNQNFEPLNQLDPQTTIQLLFRKKPLSEM